MTFGITYTGNLKEIISTDLAVLAPSEHVIGYRYNLWALKATSLSGEETYSFSGRIFLDKRKAFKAHYSKSEHSYLYKHKFRNGEVFHFNGKNKYTEVREYDHTKDFYVALKFDREWVHHSYEDILESVNDKEGLEIGCETCNFNMTTYDVNREWAFTLFYEIRPIYKEGYEPTDKVLEEVVETVIKKTKEPIQSDENIGSINNEERSEAFANDDTGIENLVYSNGKKYHVLIKVLDNPNERFDELKELGPLYKETFEESGTTRYLIGESYSYKEIKELVIKLKDYGFENCMIAKYQKGKLKSYMNP